MRAPAIPASSGSSPNRQESGRGRRGRAWETPQGNLAATLLLVSGRDLHRAATLGFVAGLALVGCTRRGRAGGQRRDRRRMAAAVRRRRFELKWPNDVLANGAKLAGILLESTMLSEDRAAIAVGIGVNVVAYPEDVPYPATSLRALGATCDAETLFLALSDAWSDTMRAVGRGRGPSTHTPALAGAGGRAGRRGRGAGRRQDRARHIRDDRRGLPLRHPRGGRRQDRNCGRRRAFRRGRFGECA